MLWMNVTIPRTDAGSKQELSSRLNQEFIDATGFETEVLFIRFSEYEAGDVAASGLLYSGAGEAFAHVVLYAPRLRFDVKRSLVASITNILESKNWKCLIHLLEVPYDNIGMNGQLLTDADDELASRPFYYMLPR